MYKASYNNVNRQLQTKNFRGGYMEGSKQLNSVSVLELLADKGSPANNTVSYFFDQINEKSKKKKSSISLSFLIIYYAIKPFL